MTEQVAEATNETVEGETPETSETESTDVFTREYVEELRKEAARYRTENKTSTDRLAEVEQELTTTKESLKAEKAASKEAADKTALEVTRWKVAAQNGLSEEDVELFLTASDEETLVKQAERIKSRSSHAPKPDAAQGNRDGKAPLTTAQQFAKAVENAF